MEGQDCYRVKGNEPFVVRRDARLLPTKLYSRVIRIGTILNRNSLDFIIHEFYKSPDYL